MFKMGREKRESDTEKENVKVSAFFLGERYMRRLIPLLYFYLKICSLSHDKQYELQGQMLLDKVDALWSLYDQLAAFVLGAC